MGKCLLMLLLLDNYLKITKSIMLEIKHSFITSEKGTNKYFSFWANGLIFCLLKE
jgi:hypothetical protein